MNDDQPVYEIDMDQLSLLCLYGFVFYLAGKVLAWW